MTYEVGFKPAALRQLRKLSEEIQKLIITVIKVGHRRNIYR